MLSRIITLITCIEKYDSITRSSYLNGSGEGWISEGGKGYFRKPC